MSTVDKWSAQRYNTNASFVYSSQYTSPTLNLLAPRPGERILDLGCGSGDLTVDSLLPAVLPGGSIVGLDASSDLLFKARQNLASSSAISNDDKSSLSWIECDGHDLASLGQDGEFDAVFSNAALHWMKRDPQRVVNGVYGLLKSGGRFVGEMGGALNMVGVRSALHTVLAERGVDASKVDPWFFPTPEVYQAILEKAGFRVESCDLVPRPTPLPTALRGWLETFAFAFLDALPSQAGRESVIDEVCRRLEVDMKHDVGDGGEGKWTVMYVRLRFKAWKD
ncbi:cyclopropane-fatty-acyl-phospholipid synthase [Rhodotorula toruloides]|uniref:Cyclopropane-fatty-acyl-phospholipid synthase n=1 Tax=Rhodotorula toruloides TaxID=5286 RepID=A0A511KT23_RHOTO|nr:cyclopropane-fatty-acyl-phospholipid synthase [Rhodotorula toruloides]